MGAIGSYTFQKFNKELVMPTVKVKQETWDKAEKIAVDATLLRRTPVQISEVIRYVIENNLEKGLKDFISKEKLKAKR
ncbi:MAG: hypothetical protein HRT38_15770 [Alteromonadaceae bacterium]|nr:hypothetical protein [Alteromonadaceae bacterium]